MEQPWKNPITLIVHVMFISIDPDRRRNCVRGTRNLKIAGSLDANLKDSLRRPFAVTMTVACLVESLIHSCAASPLLHVAIVEKMATHVAVRGGRQRSCSFPLVGLVGHNLLPLMSTAQVLILNMEHKI